MGCATTAPHHPPSVFSRVSDPETEIASALEIARNSGRRVLLVFGADWCRDSRRMCRRLTHDEALSRLIADEFVVVTVDVGERDGPRWDSELVRRYGRPFAGRGIPAMVVLGPDGEPLFSPAMNPLRDSDHRRPRKVQRFLEQWVATDSLTSIDRVRE
jgi:thiol:disulfide interchange protein